MDCPKLAGMRGRAKSDSKFAGMAAIELTSRLGRNIPLDQHPDIPSRLTRRAWLGAAGAAALTACRPREAAARRIRIGYQRNGVLLLAKSRGLVAKALAPTVIEWVEFPAGPPMLEAMSAGAVDLGATGDAPPIFAQASGAPLSYAAVQPVTGDSEGLLVPPRSRLRDARDLRGKRIALTRGTSAHIFLVKVLKSVGMTLSDIKPVFLAPADAASAFAGDSFDAWAVWDPYLALAQRDQKARILVSGVGLPLSDSFFLASNRLIQTAPSVLAALLDALRTEAAWGNAHTADMVRITAAATGLPPDVIETSLRRGPLAVNPVTPEVLARQQLSADTFAELGFIPRHVRVADAAWTGWRPQT
jgi:sulfonate transport system substrate-binding protein